MERRTVVNALTLGRLPFVALGTWAALEGARLPTITFGMAAVATDIGDGMLARRWDVESKQGSNLDSLMDAAFYLLLLYWVYLFAPATVLENLGLLATFILSYGAVLLVGQLLERSIAQHDRISRAAGTVGGLSALWFIVRGYEPWLFFVASLFIIADIAHRIHGAVQAIARHRRGVDGGA